MARYFFHLRDGTDHLLDHDGIEFDTVEQAQAEGLRNARDTLSNDIRQGLIDLRYRIDVEDEHGFIVYTIALGDAFVVVEANS